MRARKLCLVALICGLLLIALSLGVGWLRGPRTAWTEQEAQQHARSAAQLHKMAHRRAEAEAARQAGKSAAVPPPHRHAHGEEDHPPTDAQIEQARAEFVRTKAELDQARASGRTIAAVLRSLGLLCVVGGGGAYLLLGRQM